MDYFFDTTHFLETIGKRVPIVRQLPPALRPFAADEVKQPLEFINPGARPHRQCRRMHTQSIGELEAVGSHVRSAHMHRQLWGAMACSWTWVVSPDISRCITS